MLEIFWQIFGIISFFILLGYLGWVIFREMVGLAVRGAKPEWNKESQMLGSGFKKKFDTIGHLKYEIKSHSDTLEAQRKWIYEIEERLPKKVDKK